MSERMPKVLPFWLSRFLLHLNVVGSTLSII